MYVLAALCVLHLFCSAPTSSQDWPLDCDPRKIVPYHSDNGKLFRENEVWNYTTMVLREDLGLIILGTRGAIYALDINDITKKKASVPWDVTDAQQTECTYKGKNSEIDCQNYIRILHKTEDGRMYVCGTNAFHPMCDYLSYTDGQLILQNKQEDGKGKCPFDPFQRYSSVWVGVRTLSIAELNELLEEVETAIRRYSEELVQQLALRDELDFEKEVKNSFISILIDVQNRQKEHRELLRKKKKLKAAGAVATPPGRSERTLGPGTRFSMEGISTAIQNGLRQTFGTGGGEKQYLTTVIPYERKGGPPSVEDLQILTKILQAMRDDSDKVPTLLTDYILKVLCPT